MISSDPWYTIKDIDQLDTPALVIYPNRVKANINTLKSSIDDMTRLRVHVKTHKSTAATQLLLNAGLTKFKCATIAEAEMLGICHAPDVLLAYLPNRPKLYRFIDLIKSFPDTSYSCLVDNGHSASDLDLAAKQAGVIISVYLDINAGMNRTGILPDEKALRLYQICSALPNLQLKGLHIYDGHIHEPDFELRKQQCDAAFTAIYKLKEDIVNSGLAEPGIIAGGSPTLPFHALTPGIECSAGTFIYWDQGYTEQLPEQDYIPAALVVSRVVSLPASNRICLDVGHKSISSENILHKRIRFLNAPDLIFTGHSEEHLTAETSENHNFKVGDVLYGIPYHVCPTVALYERASVVNNGRVSGEWLTTARDRKINI